MHSEKPLFVPLKTEHFLAFADGGKSVEYRRHGPRWNEKNCRVGRDVVLSHGYSGARLLGTVSGFAVRRMTTDTYGVDAEIACISIRLAPSGLPQTESRA